MVSQGDAELLCLAAGSRPVGIRKRLRDIQINGYLIDILFVLLPALAPIDLQTLFSAPSEDPAQLDAEAGFLQQFPRQDAAGVILQSGAAIVLIIPLKQVADPVSAAISPVW